MDLGSLELQIFVSLTVVLGAAFVALVCDYLKGNNEQLRERNIELLVRKEETERRQLLDPQGLIGQWLPGKSLDRRRGAHSALARGKSKRPAGAHEMMQSFAEPEALEEVEERAATLQARLSDETFEPANVQPMAKPRSARGRGNARKSAGRRGEAQRPVEEDEQDGGSNGWRGDSKPADPVGEEVGSTTDSSNGTMWKRSGAATELQKEIERIAAADDPQPEPSPAPIIRPLTVPSLQLHEELHRIVEHSSPAMQRYGASWNSPLLDEVIAASVGKVHFAVVETETVVHPRPTASAGLQLFAEAEVELDPAPPVSSPSPETVAVVEPVVEVAETPEEPAESVAPPIEPALAGSVEDVYMVAPQASDRAGMGIPPDVSYFDAVVEAQTPALHLVLSGEPILSAIACMEKEMTAEDDSLPDLLPALMPEEEESAWEAALPMEGYSLVEEVTAEDGPLESEPDFDEEVESFVAPAPPPPIDISAARASEPSPAFQVPDLLLPTGMHNAATWTRLLSLPNPMTGILFVITLQAGETSAPADKNKSLVPSSDAPAVEKLMASFVREGDFGTQTSENEWVFVYSHDVAGFNQRRVGMISEKLWDFQLRHLGTADVSFKWGAVAVKSEPLGNAVQAARDRMNQSSRSRKLPGADGLSPRRVVNA